MNALQNPFSLLARLLMAALFLPAGLSKLNNFTGTAGYIGSVGLPLPEVGAVIAIVVELVAPALLIVGLFTRHAALVLAAFTLVASVFFHAYWSMPADQQFMQSLMFWKNIGVVGGLLAIAAFGAGAFSIDARRSR